MCLQASERELQLVIRITIVVTGVAGTALAFFKNSILVLWVLAADLGYCVILPQLICVLFCPVSNVYGAGVGYFMGILLRLLSGEPLIGLPPVIHFLGGEITDGVYIQQAPIRSIAMLFTLLCILLFSYLFTQLFRRGILPKTWDVLGVNEVMTPGLDQTGSNAEGERLMMTSPSGSSTVKRSNLEVEDKAKL